MQSKLSRKQRIRLKKFNLLRIAFPREINIRWVSSKTRINVCKFFRSYDKNGPRNRRRRYCKETLPESECDGWEGFAIFKWLFRCGLFMETVLSFLLIFYLWGWPGIAVLITIGILCCVLWSKLESGKSSDQDGAGCLILIFMMICILISIPFLNWISK